MQLGSIYTLYVGSKNPEQVCVLAVRYLKSFSMQQGIGCWKGNLELSTTIVHITDNEGDVTAFAEAVKQQTGEETVLISKQQSEFLFA